MRFIIFAPTPAEDKDLTVDDEDLLNARLLLDVEQDVVDGRELLDGSVQLLDVGLDGLHRYGL